MLWATLVHALDLVGLREPARQARKSFEARLRPLGVSAWTPLVPEQEFEDCLRHALRALRDAEGADPRGAYLEFGVSRGTSTACAFRALQAEGLDHVPMVGFDSFEGMPPEAAGQGWEPGQYRSSLSATRRYLARQGVPRGRVRLVKGWFRDTLTPATRERLGLRLASVVLVDCDIHSASREALAFAAPLIGAHSVLIFDDWGWRADRGEIGQKEAFEEFMAANPALRASPLPAYIPQARVFLLSRRSG
jgi:O-methyltransferase